MRTSNRAWRPAATDINLFTKGAPPRKQILAKGFALEIPTTSGQRSNNALHCLGIRKIC